MSTRLLLLATLCVVGLTVHAQQNGIANEQALRTMLFTGYDASIRPMDSQNQGQVAVGFDVQLNDLMDISLEDGKMTTSISLTLRWRDARLRWDPLRFMNVSRLNAFAALNQRAAVWLPDVVNFNSAVKSATEGGPSFRGIDDVIVTFDGNVTFHIEGILSSMCDVSDALADFPRDSQSCQVIVMSWRYSSEQMRIDLMGDAAESPYRWQSAQWDRSLEWHVDDVRIDVERAVPVPWFQRSALEYASDRLTLTIDVTRRSEFYVRVLLLPVILITCVSFGVMLLGAKSRMEQLLVLLLVLTAFSVVIADYVINAPEATKVEQANMAAALLIFFACIETSLLNFSARFERPVRRDKCRWERCYALCVRVKSNKAQRRAIEAGEAQLTLHGIATAVDAYIFLPLYGICVLLSFLLILL
jgi:Neurotransmitter-gated ion-channel ligand binding domain